VGLFFREKNLQKLQSQHQYISEQCDALIEQSKLSHCFWFLANSQVSRFSLVLSPSADILTQARPLLEILFGRTGMQNWW
jgi:hypothetical protein